MTRTPGTSRRATLRAATAIGAVAALSAAFVAGAMYGPGDADPDGSDGPGAGTALFLPASAPLGLAEDCEALLDDYRERGVAEVTAYGWQDRFWFYDMGIPMETAARGQATPEAGTARTSRVTTSETGTNVQEVGVDEPDLTKSDGTHLYTLDGNQLTTYDVSTPTGKDEPDRLATLRLPDLDDADGVHPLPGVRSELLLVGDRLVAIGAPTRTPRGEQPDTRIVVLDVADPAAPEVVDELTVDARVDSVRLHDDVVRLVLASGLPDLDFVQPDGDRSERAALRHNRNLVRETTLADWLPQLADADGDGAGAGDETLVACDRVAVPQEESALGTTTVLTLDPATTPDGDLRTHAVAVAARTDVSYASTDRLVLAHTPDGMRGGWARESGALTRTAGRTRLWSFELDGVETTYAASGLVAGHVADRWSIDSADGILRVAVGETVATGNFNSVVTLAEEDGELVELGRVDKLGVNEDIKAVRWFDDLALVVTFRQVDPLYAIDLSDPADPELLAELKIPGFSEYLHPLGSKRMIGMGQDADPRTGRSKGAQASLFDVSDLTDLRRLDTVTYPRGSVAGAAADPRQFLWVPEHRTALTVVSRGGRGRTGWLTHLHLVDGKFQENRTEVEYGSDVDRVRLVPLPDVTEHGKVLLVTGDGVRFVDVT